MTIIFDYTDIAKRVKGDPLMERKAEVREVRTMEIACPSPIQPSKITCGTCNDKGGWYHSSVLGKWVRCPYCDNSTSNPTYKDSR